MTLLDIAGWALVVGAVALVLAVLFWPGGIRNRPACKYQPGEHRHCDPQPFIVPDSLMADAPTPRTRSLNPADIPAEVREWWRQELNQVPPPEGLGKHLPDLVEEARRRWPDRDPGHDATVMMYAAAARMGAP